MANSPTEFYAIQPAFTGGEISDDVASRVDLEKYQLSLLKAENAVIRPYGSVKKRQGSIFCGSAKYANKKTILQKFNNTITNAFLLEIGHEYIRVWENGEYIGVEIATPYQETDLEYLRFVQSIDVMYITSRNYPVKKLIRYSRTNWQLVDIDWIRPPFGDINSNLANKLSLSAAEGTATLTATRNTFTNNMVGDWIKLSKAQSSSNIHTTSSGTTSAIICGNSWKIITHGTWTGTVIVQISDDKTNWRELRRYTSANDFNPSESGSVEDKSYLRLVNTITSGTCTADLTAYPYTEEAYVKITDVTDAKHAIVTIDGFTTAGMTNVTDWFFGAWSKTAGYPACITFFQDRLCFGGTRTKPQRIWMSRSGDYENFGVEKEAGTVTDDSAITADLLSLSTFTINHMMAGNDLIILTDGNEWTISGAQTVTPSSITPRNQQSYGSNNVSPIKVGNRIVYVQRRGSIIRDMGYSYDTDSYGGIDLTLLAKNLIKNKEIIGSSYAQEPDSTLFFVRDDGVLLLLTYIVDQKVFAWSHFTTDGKYQSVAAVSEGNKDAVYFVVKRRINGEDVQYIEKFMYDVETENQQDYVQTDSSIVIDSVEAVTEVTGLEHLEGKEVYVMSDGYLYDLMTVTNGTVTIPQAAKKITVGLPYTMIIKQPNFDISVQGSGSIQGRYVDIANVILRVTRSFDGKIGSTEELQNEIIYDPERLELGEVVLYSGDKKVTIPKGGFNKHGRIVITHDKPYPFNLSAIIRAVTIGG